VLEQLAALVRTHVDISRVLGAARGAAPLPATAPFWPVAPVCPVARPRIGYVRDAALWFYYDENLEALRRAGAELVELSLLGADPWPQLDGLYLGGGFPEEWAEPLSHSPRLTELRVLSERHVPLYAECGGFMVLARAIVRDGREYPMAGVFPVRAEFHAAPQGLGYVEATVMSDNPFHPTGTVLRGHEFHYSRCLPEPDDAIRRVLRLHVGKGMGGGEDGLLIRNTFAAYMHCYAPSMPHWAERFVAMAGRAIPTE
ncbi:MAG: cobyrinic acid a,c-diamide synthase, partial [Desulfovibrionaceae bacterium]|nr:cobyrinic acid a,c-diamide synthase [Desulfovibrionaceae bacterium]